MTNGTNQTDTTVVHGMTDLRHSENLYATVEEYADRLRVSRGTVFSWINGGLPSFRVGRTRRIVIARADRWLESGGADRTRKSARSKRSATAVRP